MKYKTLHFAELLISLGEYYSTFNHIDSYQYDWKISPKRVNKNINTENAYKNYISLPKVLGKDSVNDCKKLKVKLKI